MILVIFGSASDKEIYNPIIQTLKQKNLDFEFRICSAHRTPDMLAKILEKYYDLIIAGAGLAAHLPGVIASHTTSPIIGVPCTGNFNGLDAFFSVVQMPGGMPVLASGVNGNPANVSFLFEKHEKVNIIGNQENKRVQKCIKLLEEFSIEYEFNNNEGLKLNFYDLLTENPMPEAINVPLKDGSTIEDAQSFFAKSKDVFHLGLNRGDNAALFATQLIKPELIDGFREKAAKKVFEADEKERIMK
jgi:5-(carboxyamino)imidazole ribonucleotide mutase